MEILIVTGFVLIVAGIIGSVLPFIPGPVLSYMALILLSMAHEWEGFSPLFLIVLGAIVMVVTLLDYIIPRFIRKKYGASRLGLLGAVIGLFIGLIFFPPYGLFIGAALGAIIGEVFSRKEGLETPIARVGAFIGTIVGILYKISVSGVIASYFIRTVWNL